MTLSEVYNIFGPIHVYLLGLLLVSIKKHKQRYALLALITAPDCDILKKCIM